MNACEQLIGHAIKSNFSIFCSLFLLHDKMYILTKLLQYMYMYWS